MFRGVGIFLAGCLVASAFATGSEQVVLQNTAMRMEINLQGGAISSCVLEGETLNPFTWKSGAKSGDLSRKEGLFLCFERVGKSSKADRKRGVPFHGEATSVRWEVLGHTEDEAGHKRLKMSCKLPITQLALEREYCLFKDSSVCRVTDRVKNETAEARPYNMLHHPSMDMPFLDETVLVDCNASEGFVKNKAKPGTVEPRIVWPEIEFQGKKIDLRKMDDGQTLVANYRCAEGVELGWGCVSKPRSRLLVGTAWPTKDYSWMRVWRSWGDNRPNALGIEFGTTPLGLPFEQIEQIGDVMGLPTLHHLEPGGEVERSFYLFLAEIPKDYTGVGKVQLQDGVLEVLERDGAKRQLSLSCK